MTKQLPGASPTFDVPGLTAANRPPKTPSVSPPPVPPAAIIGIPGQQSGGGIPVPNFMPPNGFAGLAQQTAAVQSLYSRTGRSSSGGRRRRKAAKTVKRAKKAVRRARGAAKFKKGSPAARRHMAKLRRMRRK